MSNVQGDPSYQELLIDQSALIDTNHHDTPERHVFGGALLDPGTPKTNAVTPSIGISSAPARADHVHAIGIIRSLSTPLYQAGPWAPSNTVNVLVPFKCNITVVSIATCFVNTAGLRGLIPLWNGVNMGFYLDMFFNEVGTHRTVGSTNLLSNVVPGTYTLAYQHTDGNVASDLNDRGHWALMMNEVA